MKAPSSSSSFLSLLRVKPRSSSYLFTLLAFILFAAILCGHDFLFIFHPHPHSKEQTQTLFFSTPREFHSFFLFLIIISIFLFLLFHVLGSSNEGNTTETEREEEVGCDVFRGRWVRDELTRPLYEESDCPYIQPQLTCQEHGRPEKEYQRWRWQPHGCDLPT